MSNAVIKDCADIWFRLFDHRPFLSGEIRDLVKEFEEKRGDREVKTIKSVEEWVSLANNTQFDIVLNSYEKLEKLNTLVEVSLSNAESTLALSEVDSGHKLAPKRAMRQTELTNFMHQLDSQYSEIDETFLLKEQELRAFYRELDEKLHITP